MENSHGGRHRLLDHSPAAAGAPRRGRGAHREVNQWGLATAALQPVRVSSSPTGRPPTRAARQLADWAPRAGGFVIDWLIIFVPSLILDILSSATKAGFFVFLGYLWGIGMWVWFSVQVGTAGTSPGMRVVGLRCVSKTTGQTSGTGTAILRWLLHIVDSLICFIGWFMPLWDSQRQTLSDKIVGSLVYRVPAQGFSLVPKATN